MVSETYKQYEEFKKGAGPYKEKLDILMAVNKQMHDIPPAYFQKTFTI